MYIPETVIEIPHYGELISPTTTTQSAEIIDLTTYRLPFFAVDDRNPHEVDDAIRIDRLKNGGFLVESAIADGGQLAGNNELVDEAIRKRHNRYYRDEVTRAILPNECVDRLQLKNGYNHATVIRQKFTKTLEQQGDVEIFPANVKVATMDYKGFGRQCLLEMTKPDHPAPFVDFLEKFRAERGLKRRAINPDSSPGNIRRHSIRMVGTFMVLANMAFAQWANQNDVPIIYREFPDGKQRNDDEDYIEGNPIYANYTPDLLPHHGIAGFDSGILYTHVTSPLRRAADLLNHIQLTHALAKKEVPFNKNSLDEITVHLNDRTRLKAV